MHGQYLIIYRRASTSVHTPPRGTRKAIGSQAGGGATVETRRDASDGQTRQT